MPERSQAWKQLTRLAADSIRQPLLSMVNDENRFAEFSFTHDGLLLDLSRQRLTGPILTALVELARARGIEQQRELLFNGGVVNPSEGRPALHTALRAPAGARPASAGTVESVQAQMRDLSERIRDTRWRGYSGKSITDVVHIGIGGSHLGPELVASALVAPGALPRVRFVANVDAHALSTALSGLDPARTLFVIVSKSFTTLETRLNAESARSWFLERVPDTNAIARHFVAVSSNLEAAAAFGIPGDNCLQMWDWLGGRYSLWSAVGLPILLQLGNHDHAQLLAGAHAMDQHFRTAALGTNLPVVMALTGIWNYNFLGVTNHAILPYAERLALLPAYLQQLMMESNGKAVQTDGHPVSVHTMPVIWGGVGTNGQHAYHQLLHQGTRAFTADFVLSAADEHQLADHQRWLLANALGQSQAMLTGDHNTDPHQAVRGNHATTTIVLPEIAPRYLGALLALYEHCVFCQGVIWNINSFDQWGVELGKRLAIPIHKQLSGDSAIAQDAPTRGMIEYLRGLQNQTIPSAVQDPTPD